MLPLVLLFSFACGPKPANQDNLPIENYYYEVVHGGYEGAGNTYVVHLLLKKATESFVPQKIRFRGIESYFESNSADTLHYLAYLKIPLSDKEKLILHGDITKEYGNVPPAVVKDSLQPDEALLYYTLSGRANTLKLKPMKLKAGSDNPRLRN